MTHSQIAGQLAPLRLDDKPVALALALLDRYGTSSVSLDRLADQIGYPQRSMFRLVTQIQRLVNIDGAGVLVVSSGDVRFDRHLLDLQLGLRDDLPSATDRDPRRLAAGHRALAGPRRPGRRPRPVRGHLRRRARPGRVGCRRVQGDPGRVRLRQDVPHPVAGRASQGPGLGRLRGPDLRDRHPTAPLPDDLPAPRRAALDRHRPQRRVPGRHRLLVLRPRGRGAGRRRRSTPTITEAVTARDRGADGAPPRRGHHAPLRRSPRCSARYLEATNAGDAATADGLLAWLGGQPHVAASIKRSAGVKGDLDHDAALSFLAGLLAILRDAGFGGLVLVLDEVETMQRMRSDTRDKGLEALRKFIDDLYEGRFPGLYLVITGTPAFFDGPQGVQRLTPLAQRLHTDFGPDPRFDNPRAVQIRLQGFDLDSLVAVGRRVRDLFAEGADHPDRILTRCDDDYLADFAREVAGELGAKVGVAPRIFIKKLDRRHPRPASTCSTTSTPATTTC